MTETYIKRLKSKGLKVTPQRLAIMEAVDRSNSHLSVEQIFFQLKTRHPSLSLTTVYRTLETLTRSGEIRMVVLGDGMTRYDRLTRFHHHAVCRRCGRIMDVEPQGDCRKHVPEAVAAEFVIEDCAMIFWGTCRDCSGGQNREKGNGQ